MAVHLSRLPYSSPVGLAAHLGTSSRCLVRIVFLVLCYLDADLADVLYADFRAS